MKNLLEFSGITAKVRAMQAKLLEPEDYEHIVALSSVGNIVSYLRGQPAYTKLLEPVEEKMMHRIAVETLLILSLYQDYTKLYNFASKKQRQFLKLYLKRYEIDLINYCFRIVFNHYDQPFDLIYKKDFFDKYSQISIEKLITSTTVGDLVDNLKDTEYYTTLKKLHERNANTLYDYDLALNLYYFSTLWNTQRKILKGKELQQFKKDYGTKIDLLNLQWIYRAKKYYFLTNAELYHLLIPIHYKIPTDKIQELVETPSIDEWGAVMETTYYAYKYDLKQEFALEKVYSSILYRLYMSDRKQNPFSIATINAYLFLKEKEIDKLTTALECIRYGLSVQETLEYLNQR